MGFSFLKKQQYCSSENERASGRRRVVLHHHSTELLLYLQMVASSERPRTDCKKCNHRGAATANWRPHSKRPKEDFEWKRPKKNPNPLKIWGCWVVPSVLWVQSVSGLYSVKLRLSEKREIMAFKVSYLSRNSRWMEWGNDDGLVTTSAN